MKNIQLDYLYRDEGNYKDYGSVIYSNPNKLSIEHVVKIIDQHLIEGTWFDPDKWHISRFSFHRVNAFGIDDYLWYEFVELSYTNASANGGCIEHLLEKIVNS